MAVRVKAWLELTCLLGRPSQWYAAGLVTTQNLVLVGTDRSVGYRVTLNGSHWKDLSREAWTTTDVQAMAQALRHGGAQAERMLRQLAEEGWCRHEDSV